MTSQKNIKADAPIGIMDSGIGGMTVLKEISKILPNENIIYVGDEAHYPYGNKNVNEIISYTKAICDWLIGQGVKMIVIACNTITAAAYDFVKEYVDVPVVGVVKSGVDVALESTKNNNIGVLATQATVNLGIYRKTIFEKDVNKHVVSVAAPKLTDYVENELDMVLHNPTDQLKDDIASYLSAFKKNKCDTVLLACTHYPFLESLISDELGEGVAVVSPSKYTAEEVAKRLQEKSIQNNAKATYSFYTTGQDIDKLKMFWDAFNKDAKHSFKKLEL